MKPARLSSGLLKTAGRLIALAVLLPALYLAAALAGGMIPRQLDGPAVRAHAGEPGPVTVYLVTGLLHADIALPASDELLTDFPGLKEAGLPLDHPGLRYLAFGWGSRAFYTTAGDYSDITFSATWQAASGDKPVMRVTPMGPLSAGDNVVELNLPAATYGRLVSAIREGFVTNADGQPIHLQGASIGQGDAFFHATGHFNLFNPCNQWVGDVLHSAGIRIGMWTPVTHSLIRSLRRHSPHLLPGTL